MGKYDFIKLGNLLYWHDPDSGLSNGVYQVASIPENIEEDSVILIASDTSEAEVFPSELSPIHTGRSWKSQSTLTLLAKQNLPPLGTIELTL